MNRLKGATVLVVDDELDLCDMLAFEFSLQGSRVLSAATGEEAFAVLQAKPVDAVVTDIQMPNGSGVQLLDRLRATNCSAPPVVLITAYDTVISPIEAYDRGAEGIFGKPFRLKDLIDRVERVLAEPRLRWADPPEVEAQIEIARRWPGIEPARRARQIEAGRGGMALALEGANQTDQAEPGCPVSLDIRFDSGPVGAIEGMATVRWRIEQANAKTICGIELEYLAPGCRESVVEWLAANPGKPFIPRLDI